MNNYAPPPVPMNNYGSAAGPYTNPYPQPFPPTATGYTNYGIDRYYGIGGWLILPAIGVVINPLLLAFATLQGLAAFASISVLERNGIPAGGLQSMILMETMGNAMLFIFSIVLAVQFFRKRKVVPILFIVFMLAHLLFAILDSVVGQTVLNNMAVAMRTRGGYSGVNNPLDGVHYESLITIARSAIACLIWIPYFKVSKRVKATFVH
jgi:hypothetical protein